MNQSPTQPLRTDLRFASLHIIKGETGEAGILSSPFWFAAEGAVIGLIIDYLATKFGGEGKETVGK